MATPVVSYPGLLREITAARLQGRANVEPDGQMIEGDDIESQAFLKQWQAVEAHCEFRDPRVELLIRRVDELERKLYGRTALALVKVRRRFSFWRKGVA